MNSSCRIGGPIRHDSNGFPAAVNGIKTLHPCRLSPVFHQKVQESDPDRLRVRFRPVSSYDPAGSSRQVRRTAMMNTTTTGIVMSPSVTIPGRFCTLSELRTEPTAYQMNIENAG